MKIVENKSSFHFSKCMKNLFILLTPILLFAHCAEEAEQQFAPLQPIDSTSSAFVLHPAEKLYKDRNTIYAASSVMAWDELRHHFKGMSDFSNDRIRSLHYNHVGDSSLNEFEYSSETMVNGNVVSVRSQFSKSLPFHKPFHTYELPFKGTEVKAFGFSGYHKDADMLYYQSNKDFAIRIQPKDFEHEIILIKTPKFLGSMENVFKYLTKEQNSFERTRTERNDWKYVWNDEDEVRIPVINFQVYDAFTELLNSKFTSSDKQYLITEFYQRTAFLLNEKGAEVESETMIEASEAMDIEDLPQPKLLHFDDDFIVFLKRKDKAFPYFALKCINSHLMQLP